MVRALRQGQRIDWGWQAWRESLEAERRRGGSESEWRAWQRRAQMAHRLVCDHRHANLFLHAIKDRDAPAYSNLVKRPMDLKLLKHLVDTGAESADGTWLVRSTTAYVRALRLMFANAVMYNPAGSDIATMAREMDREVLPQAIVNSPSSALTHPVFSPYPGTGDAGAKERAGERGGERAARGGSDGAPADLHAPLHAHLRRRPSRPPLPRSPPSHPPRPASPPLFQGSASKRGRESTEGPEDESPAAKPKRLKRF